MLALLLASMLTATFNFQLTKAELGTLTVDEDPFNYQGKYVIDETKLGGDEKNALPYVQKYAEEQRVSPALLMAITKQESNFDPNAIGDGGLAIGYMQLHWDAAYDAGYRSARGDSTDYAREDWPTDGLDPHTNIKYGCAYLKICYDKHKDSSIYGDPLKNAISAYNLGWPHGPDKTNENSYVNPILQSYENYKGKYAKAWGKSHNVAVVDDYYGSAVGYLYPSNYPNQIFSTLSASQVSAEALANYDTVILFMFNPSGLTAARKAAINDWVYKGGKLMIWDSDQVPRGSLWDYTWLPYPFTTSVPGQTGQTGKGLNILEENQLSSSDPSSPYYIDTAVLNRQTDAVGDANVLISYSPGWRIDMMATNVLGETGPAHVYAAYGSGLLIYSALDWDYAGYGISGGQWLKKLLKQELECSYLPFVAPPVLGEVGFKVEIAPEAPEGYYTDKPMSFKVTVTNPTDQTGINIIAYNVVLNIIVPEEIEIDTTTATAGNIAPGESKTVTFSGEMKKTGENIEVIVNARGEDRILWKTIAGSGSCFISVHDPEAPKPDWSFATITDLHIGYGYLDYGDEGFEDGNSGESYSLTEMLESAVGTIIAERDCRDIRFVVVTGDISDTAEESEFLKAREILNSLNDPNGDGNTEDGIPYIPLIGNHDTSPYTQKNNPVDRPLPGQIPGTDNLQTRATYGGDVIFHRVFWETNPSNYELILNKIDDKFLRDSVPVYSLALGHFLYLENYAFDYGGIGFVCLDAAERGPISAVYPSSSPIAKYWKQTKDFLIDQLKDHTGQELILFSHFPLYGLGGFLDTQDVASSIVKYGCTGTLNFAGHTHRNHVQDVWKYDWLGRPAQYAYTVIETEALSQIPVELVVEGYPLVKSTHSGESIRIVQREGTEFDYSTTLKPRKQVDILWPNPFFTHTYASYPQPNSEITFTAHTIVYHGFKTSFQWDFGDGNFGSGSSLAHSYSQEGEYEVTLSITSRNLLTGGETSQVVIGSIYVHSKHVISPLPPDLSATSLVTEEDLTKTPTNTYQPVLIAKRALEEIAIGEFGVHFGEATDDIDLSNLVADVNLEEGKSVIYMPTWPEEIDQYKQLFIPSTGAGTVYICLDAASLDDVSLKNADVILNVGETKVGITVTTTFYNDREYYLVSGVTGIGGGELKDTIPPTTTREIGEPKYVDPMDNIHVTSATPFTLTAEDNPGGTGVESIFYRIYDAGWLEYSAPFYLTGLSDGEYSIDYYSTDTIGNTEPTHTFSITLDNSGPLIAVENPLAGWALQNGVTFIASASDSSGTRGLNFSIREANGDQGIPVGFEDIPATYDAITGRWNWYFDTLQLPDGYYIVLVNAEDNLGHTASTTVPYSIRNWAVLELLPASENNKAGRTMPVKFALRVATSVDPDQPFVYNQELTIKIYAMDNPSNILQTSTFGDTSKDYRINAASELYITNFQTLKTPETYVVEVYRKGMLIDSFQFYTVFSKIHQYIAAE